MFRRKMNALGYRIAAGCESVVRLQLMENRCLIAAIYESVQRVEYKGSSLCILDGSVNDFVSNFPPPIADKTQKGGSKLNRPFNERGKRLM
jgi:hypothetical protein